MRTQEINIKVVMAKLNKAQKHLLTELMKTCSWGSTADEVLTCYRNPSPEMREEMIEVANSLVDLLQAEHLRLWEEERKNGQELKNLVEGGNNES